jgi:1-acyl-sn-glycerol-3-phosphate acyltransferase
MTTPSSPPVSPQDSNPHARFYRLLYRLPLVLVYIIIALSLLTLLHLRRAPVYDRAACLHRWCARILRWLGLRLRTIGTPPADGVIVANHQSYLDIFIASAATPCVFVSKKEVRAYPVIGITAALAGTIFIDRHRSASLQAIGVEMEDALRDHVPVCFFPEGTTTDGRSLLRFHAALFAPAVRLGSTVTPAAITYALPQGGDPAQLVAYWGPMTMLPHALRLLTLPRVEATLHFSPDRFIPAAPAPNAPTDHHHQAARNAANRAHDIVLAMLSSRPAS